MLLPQQPQPQRGARVAQPAAQRLRPAYIGRQRRQIAVLPDQEGQLHRHRQRPGQMQLRAQPAADPIADQRGGRRAVVRHEHQRPVLPHAQKAQLERRVVLVRRPRAFHADGAVAPRGGPEVIEPYILGARGESHRQQGRRQRNPAPPHHQHQHRHQQRPTCRRASTGAAATERAALDVPAQPDGELHRR